MKTNKPEDVKPEELADEIDFQLEGIGTLLAQSFEKLAEQSIVVTKLCKEVERNRLFLSEWGKFK